MSPWIISHSARRKISWGCVAGSLWDFETCFNRLWVYIWMSFCLYFTTRRKSILWKSSSIRVWRHWLMYVTSHEKGAQYFYFGCQSVEWLAVCLHHLTARRGSTQQIRRWSWFRRWERLFESQCWKCIVLVVSAIIHRCWFCRFCSFWKEALNLNTVRRWCIQVRHCCTFGISVGWFLFPLA